MNALLNNFKSNHNKGYIWKLLNDHNSFNGIDDKYINNIKKDFDDKINFIANKILHTDNLIILNKKVIYDMINILSSYKQNNSTPITSAETHTQNQDLFQKNLEIKKTEFDILINTQKPNSINFSDDMQDKPNTSEMERKLAETIEWRKKELNVVLDIQDKTEADKWINKDNNTNTPLLKIDKNTSLNNINVINLDKNKKKVSFDNTNITHLDNIENNIPLLDKFENNFLSLLKKKDTQKISQTLEDEISFIKIQIGKILENQKILLENLLKLNIQ